MATVDFGLLGPLEARISDRQLAIVGPKRRALLALLLLHHNLLVSADRIIDGLWGDDPPPSARTQVHSLVSALRRKFGASETGVNIVTRPPGYLLRVDPDRIDLTLFERRVANARSAAAAGQLSTAAEAFRDALALWRGPALDGVDAPFVTAEAARLEEQRFVALEERIAAELGLGRHGALVAELVSLVGEHPLREGLRASLMLALYRSGRRAEALEVYRRGHEVLVEDEGLDPSRRLRELERAILQDEPSLQLGARDPRSAPASAPASVSAATGEPPGGPVLTPSPDPGPQPPEQPRLGGRATLARRSRRGIAAAAMVAVLSLVTAPAGPARSRAEQAVGLVGLKRPPAAVAAPPCVEHLQTVTDYRGRAFERVYHCGTWVGQNLYANPQDLGPLDDVSFMNSAPDVWVVCQLHGRPNPMVGGRDSTWWLYTQGDARNRPNDYGYTNAWAFLPANVVRQSRPDQPVPGVPVCAMDAAVPGMPSVSTPDSPAGHRQEPAGGTGTFVCIPVTGTTDLAGFVYALDSDAPDSFVAATGPATIRVRLPNQGPHTLYVRARDQAGNLSPARSQKFEVSPSS